MFEESGWYIVNPLNLDLFNKRFITKKEAEAALKPIKKIAPFNRARIIEGSSDAYGIVTPFRR